MDAVYCDRCLHCLCVLLMCWSHTVDVLCKNGWTWTDRDAIWRLTLVSQGTICIRRGWDLRSPTGRGNFRRLSGPQKALGDTTDGFRGRGNGVMHSCPQDDKTTGCVSAQFGPFQLYSLDPPVRDTAADRVCSKTDNWIVNNGTTYDAAFLWPFFVDVSYDIVSLLSYSCCHIYRLAIITSPAEAVAKYCNERVCVSVWLSACEHISRTTRAIFTIFVHVAY